jgi:anti-sigma factor RsiW
MNRDFQLKLQAYLDGELFPQETEKVIHSLRTDPEALALHEELKLTKSLLQGNELEIKLGESREFYWSKICREIGRDNQRKGPGPLRRLLSWRWFVPVGGVVALLAIFAALSVKNGSPSLQRLASAQETETHLEDMSLISFRSESEGISVVWLNSR